MIRQIQLFGVTDVGRQRTHNEDNFAICKDVSEKQWGFRRSEILELSVAGAVLVVADGMGGTNAGEIASDIAQQYVMDAFNGLEVLPKSGRDREKWLKEQILGAHKAIVKHQHEHLDTAGMGTTLIVVWIVGDTLHSAWSGDSRCYIWSGEEYLRPFTDDHSMVWEMVKAGNMTPEEARTHPESNLIMQSLGTEGNPPKPSVRSRKLFKGDRVVVCSDGLNGMMSDEAIRSVLAENLDTADTCSRLVNIANEGGGDDNITCLLLDVKDGEERPAGVADDVVATTVRYREGQNDSSASAKTRPIFWVLPGVILLVVALFFWIRSADDSGDVGLVGTELPVEVPDTGYSDTASEPSRPVPPPASRQPDDDVRLVPNDTTEPSVTSAVNNEAAVVPPPTSNDIVPDVPAVVADTTAIAPNETIEVGATPVVNNEAAVVPPPTSNDIVPDVPPVVADTTATTPPDTTGNGSILNHQ
jgi:serine/threonine protein phosphatase PrpC